MESEHKPVDPLALQKEDFAAAYLNIAVRTLRDWRIIGQGPKYVRINRMVRYRKIDLDEWASARLQQSTSEQSFRSAG